ncbi:MAG: hypothetical protein PHW72_03115 [Candidatus Pacebacteria bacterium]|nr:hypothetical protein [Candidatus Paceibacterota bacterium]
MDLTAEDIAWIRYTIVCAAAENPGKTAKELVNLVQKEVFLKVGGPIRGPKEVAESNGKPGRAIFLTDAQEAERFIQRVMDTEGDAIACMR